MTHYLHGHHDSVLRSHRWRTAENSAAYLLGRLRPGLSLVDIGCGPGTITADLAELVAPGRVVALDRSAEVVEEARGVAAGRGLDNVEFVVGDVYAPGLPAGAFDVVHAHQVLQHLPDPIRALRELRRLARPGGVVAVRDGDYATMTWFPEVSELDEWLELYHAVARASGGEPDAGRRLLSWARAAGFTEVTATASVWCHATDDERAWWGGLWAERVTGSAFARRAVELELATEADLARLSAGWRRWAESPDGWFVSVHGELLAVA